MYIIQIYFTHLKYPAHGFIKVDLMFSKKMSNRTMTLLI